ncbi:class I SAM-dependent methyltransferase [Candidatus Woesearchaeota archaeon]|nr:class I SAM-dependent methyltransferase [Candidatus Woesearchaeota archaeon]
MSLTTNFGAVAQIYDDARPHYSDSLIDYVASFCQGKSVLDMGCGTGIATRQLAERAVHVVGCDGDPRMIAVARSYEQPAINYVVGLADNLLFADHEFDVVTAFSAFHWFTDRASIDGIKRVLKKDGLFIVTHGVKDHIESDYFKKYAEEVITNRLSKKEKLDVGETFRASGLEIITKEEFQYELQYSVDKYLLYMQSRSYWNDVAEDQRQMVLDHVRGRFNERYPDDKVPVPRHYSVVVGKSR